MTPRRVQAVGLSEILRARTGSLIRDRYVLGRTLADSETSAVIEAADRRMRRAVAVKLFDPSAGEALPYAEARLAAIDHPNLCKVLDADHENGIPFVILERLNGETLAESLATRERFPADEAIEIFMQLLSALDAVHERGIVHRDVRPANVFLIPRPGCLPVVKLFDFATSIRRGESGFGQGAVGMRAYMAAEQVSEGWDVDARTDLFAVGVMLFEALAGQRPFAAPKHDAVFADLVRRPALEIRQIAPHVSAELASVIARAMQPLPDRRYASARAFQQALATLTVEPSSGIHAAIQRAKAQHPSATRVEVPAPNRPTNRPADQADRPADRASKHDDDTGPTRVMPPRASTGSNRAEGAAPPSSRGLKLYTPTRLSPVNLLAAPKVKLDVTGSVTVQVAPAVPVPVTAALPLNRSPADSTAPFVAQSDGDAQRSLHRMVPSLPPNRVDVHMLDVVVTSQPLPYVPPSPPSSHRERPREIPVWAIGMAIFCTVLVLTLATVAVLFY